MARMILNIGCALVLLGTIAFTQQTPDPATGMTTAAIKFLDTLSDEQERAARFPFDGEDRFDWHFIPRERKGVPLKTMTATQRSAALDLLRTALSEDGFTKAESIRQLEQILFELEGRDIRDPDLYFFMVFGEPTTGGTWGWRYEGHHLSHNWTIVNGSAVAASPQFFGTNPAEVRDGPKKGQRVLGSEEDQARALLASLNMTQKASAMLSEEAPRDVLTSNEREVAMLDDLGVSHADMDASQRGVLWSIIEEYAMAQPAAVAEQRLAEVRTAGLDNIKFGWMGGAARGEPHYYRIQGPTFLIEYDNTQGQANHVHSVWRDFEGDFGRDLLAAHYEQYPHGPVNADD
ncbi:MAG TPA: hypothetical protein DEQ98_05755 [Acidobacteria bacterium]|jgi:hypothetical protein|nr:hypothetical protein [Acidobacteriota bacterium]HCE02728.1 hypothetical protein [Acidobacteriota bacterium]